MLIPSSNTITVSPNVNANAVTIPSSTLTVAGSGTTSIGIDGSGAITATNGQFPINLTPIIDAYFELHGKVKQNSRIFIDAISKLDGVDDNFKVIKLYSLLKEKNHKAFKKLAQKYYVDNTSQYTFATTNDINTGIYCSSNDTITLAVGGSSAITIGK